MHTFLVASRHERLDGELGDGREGLDVGGEHRQAVIERGGGNERIAHLQPVAEGARLHQLGGAQRDGLGDGQQPGRALVKHLLHRDEFDLVAHALQHFKPADGRQRKCAEFIEPARGLRVATQMPDQHMGIDQHRRGAYQPICAFWPTP
jgi:hypothetical protein